MDYKVIKISLIELQAAGKADDNLQADNQGYVYLKDNELPTWTNDFSLATHYYDITDKEAFNVDSIIFEYNICTERELFYDSVKCDEWIGYDNATQTQIIRVL